MSIISPNKSITPLIKNIRQKIMIYCPFHSLEMRITFYLSDILDGQTFY